MAIVDSLDSPQLSSPFSISSILSSSSNRSTSRRNTSSLASNTTDYVHWTAVSQAGYSGEILDFHVFNNLTFSPQTSVGRFKDNRTSSSSNVGQSRLCFPQDKDIHQSNPNASSFLKTPSPDSKSDDKVCPKESEAEINLVKEERSREELFDCGICGKSYSKRCSLLSHVKTHIPTYFCSYCPKVFSREWLLKNHIRIHTKERPFVCDICKRSFADPSNKRAHMQTHTTEKRYQCDTCRNSFGRKCQLFRHKLTCQPSSATTY